jgi:hypothetical protein
MEARTETTAHDLSFEEDWRNTGIVPPTMPSEYTDMLVEDEYEEVLDEAEVEEVIEEEVVDDEFIIVVRRHQHAWFSLAQTKDVRARMRREVLLNYVLGWILFCFHEGGERLMTWISLVPIDEV